MSNVLQILSKNYSGESVNITFTPLKGSPQKFENVSLPYNFINDTFEGEYTLFFPEYNLTHKFTYPDVSPINRCRCTEFSCFSLIGNPCKVSYTTCRGETRNVSMISGQIHKDCVKEKNYKTSKGVRTTTYNYCTVLSDCIELSQPPTPQPTRTPTRTPTSTPTNTSTPTVTKTSTPTVTNTKTPTNTSTPTNTITRTSTLTPTVTSTVTQTSTPTNTLTPTVTTSVTQTNTPTTTQTPTVTTPINCPFILINQYLGSFGFRPTGIYLYDSVTNIASPITVNGFDVNLLDQLPEICSVSGPQCSGTTGSAHYYDVNTQTGKLWVKNRLDLLYEFNLGVNYEATFVTQYNCPGRFLTLKNNTTLITLTGYGNSSNVRIVEIDVSNPSLVLTPKFNLSTNVTTNPTYRDLGSLLYTNNGKLLVVARINQADSQIQQYDYESGNLEYLGPIINASNDIVPPPYQWIPESHSMFISQNKLWLCNILHFRTWIDVTSGYPLAYPSGGGFQEVNSIGNGPGQTVFPRRIDKLLGISPNSLTCNYFSFTPNVNLSPTPTQTNTPTPTITPSVTNTNTPTQSFTPSVTQTNTPTITQTITPTSLCRCVTITNLLGSANTITYQFCGYVEIGPVLIEYELEPNEVLRDCMINESVTGDNILVSYDGGTCIQIGNQRICPELPVSPTPTMTPTITQTVTPTSPINQNIIIVSGRKIFPDNTSQQGLFKYDYDLNTMTYLDISGLYAGVSHSYNFQTQTGKIWASNGGVIQEYNILNSNLDNELNRTINLTGTGYGRNLTFKNDNTLIKTILVNGERWVAEIDITETNVNPITTLKFRITSTDSNDDTFTTDLMYTNTGKFIWTNRFPNVVLQQYDFETGSLEFESPVSFQPASLFQINSQIISIQTAPVRVVYDLVTADDTLICPNILCGPTTGPTTLPGCIGQNCNLYNFESNGASSLLINNSVNFVPNQVCPIVDNFVVSQDFGTILVQNNTEYDLNVFTKNSTTLIGTVLSGQLGQFPETSFEELIVGVVPTTLEYFSTCRVCKDAFNAYVDCETGCGTLDGLEMSKTDNGETLLVTNNSTSRLYFYDSVDSLFPLFEVGANTGTNVSPSSDFQYGVIVIGVIRIDGTTCKTCFRLDNLSEIPCDYESPSILLSGALQQNNTTISNGVHKYDFLSNTVTYLNIFGNQLTGLAHYYDNITNTGFIWTKRSNDALIKEYTILNSNYDNELNRDIILTGTNYGTSLTYINNTTLVTTKKVGNEQWIVEINIDPSLPNPVETLKFQIPFGNSDIDGDLMYTNAGKLIMSSENNNYKIIEQYVYSTGYREFVSTICCRPVALWQFDGGIYSSQSGAGQIIRYDLVGNPEMVLLFPPDSIWVRPPIQCGPNVGEYLFGPDSSGCEFSFFSSAGSSLLINNNTEFIPNLF